jgi:hypothetical protein
MIRKVSRHPFWALRTVAVGINPYCDQFAIPELNWEFVTRFPGQNVWALDCEKIAITPIRIM